MKRKLWQVLASVETLKRVLKNSKCHVQRELKAAKINWCIMKANQLQVSSEKRDSKSLYRQLCGFYGHLYSAYAPFAVKGCDWTAVCAWLKPEGKNMSLSSCDWSTHVIYEFDCLSNWGITFAVESMWTGKTETVQQIRGEILNLLFGVFQHVWLEGTDCSRLNSCNSCLLLLQKGIQKHLW